jgi:hypothetical protein
VIYQVGIEPNRFDILMSVRGLDFEKAWEHRILTRYSDQSVPVLGLDDAIQAKRASGRPQDLIDLAALEAVKLRGREGRERT